MTQRTLRRMGLLLALLLGAAWRPLPAAEASTLCVNHGGTSSCFGTIAEALAAAADGDTIHIAGGAPYLERLTLTQNVSLIGDGPAATILDGGAGGQVIRITTPITVTLANLTIRNGKAGAGNNPDQYGGGIHNVLGSLTLNNVVVSGNQTGGGNACCGGDGGGISNDRGRLTLNNSLVTGNTTAGVDDNPTPSGEGGTGGGGAGIYSTNGSLILNRSTVSQNFTADGAFGDGIGGFGGPGAGIDIEGGALSLNGSAISDNGTGKGGASTGGPGGQGGSGGGIYALQSQVTLINSTVDFNGTGWGGSGASQGASGSGAGLFATATSLQGGSVVTLTTSSVSENQTGRGLTIGSGGDGGGLYIGQWVTATLLNTTVAYNSTDKGQLGGGVANANGAVFLKNSLFAHNTSASGPDAVQDCAGTITSLDYNLMMEPNCTVLPNSNGLTNDLFYVSGAIVDPPADNGGPTQTNALPPGSPAIDAADNHACPPTDQRGWPRPAFGGLLLRCDVGAFELYRYGLSLPMLDH